VNVKMWYLVLSCRGFWQRDQDVSEESSSSSS